MVKWVTPEEPIYVRASGRTRATDTRMAPLSPRGPGKVFLGRATPLPVLPRLGVLRASAPPAGGGGRLFLPPPAGATGSERARPPDVGRPAAGSSRSWIGGGGGGRVAGSGPRDGVGDPLLLLAAAWTSPLQRPPSPHSPCSVVSCRVASRGGRVVGAHFAL